MSDDVELLYRQHLTEGDRRLLAATTEGDLVRSLGHPALETEVFALAPGYEPMAIASPFLVFAVAVHRSADRLARASSVPEWVGPRRRVPVFAVGPLRDFLADPLRRYFLVELLASYTHVASGATWVRTARGWRRRRFSELDPVRFAELVELAPPAERPGILRRLGDLALFLTGVFPDHTAERGLGEKWPRLLRATGTPTTEAERGDIELFELLGAHAYQRAVSAVTWGNVPASGTVAVLDHVGRHFADARRILNTVTDWYLFPLRDRWFGS